MEMSLALVGPNISPHYISITFAPLHSVGSPPKGIISKGLCDFRKYHTISIRYFLSPGQVH